MHTTDHTRYSARQFLQRGLFAGLLLAQPAASLLAQTTTPTTEKKEDAPLILDTFTVTAGFAGSLAAAAEKKQNSNMIIEVITAEDLGKLPDVSIADTLTRLPGLAAQRTNGRAQQISLRGMGPDFSIATLNGREQVSTNLNRGVEFDQYPADLLNEVEVIKSSRADLSAQGLSGTINMKTVRPLSKGRRQGAVYANYEFNELGQLTPGVDETGYRSGLHYIDQFMDGKLGIALGYSVVNSPWAGQQFQAWGYPTDGSNAYVLGGTKSYVRNSIIDRTALMFVVQYKPDDNFEVNFDLYRSDFQEKQLLRGMEIPLWWSGAAAQPGYSVTNGYVPSMTFNNVQPVVRNDAFVRDATPLALGANIKIAQRSTWPIEVDVSYSKIERTDRNIETWSGVGFRGTPFTTADAVRVDLRPGTIPQLTTTKNYADGSVLRLSDPQGWGPTSLPGGGMHGYQKYFTAYDELGSVRASTMHELNKWGFKSFDAGIVYTDRYKRDGEKPSGFISPANGSNTLPLPPKIGTTDMSFMGLGQIYAYDPLAAFANGIWAYTPNNDSGIVANRYQIREKVTQYFGKLNIDSKMGNVPVGGDLGIRLIHTDQSSKGYSANGANLTRVSDGDKYWTVAPNLNLSFLAAERTYVRFGLSRQIARPRMFDLRASRTWGYNPANAAAPTLQNSPWSGGGGNSKLRPWESDSLDLSIERYFKDNRGYFAVAGFVKKLQNYIYEQRSVADFTGYPVLSGPEPVLRQGIVSQPVNGQGGSIKGLEVTLNLSSEMFSDIKGFGVTMNGAYTDSSIAPWGPGNGTAPIQGLSRKVANMTVYYETGGFSARVSDRYRSENRQYITTFGVPNPGGDVNPNGGFSVAQPENIIDAQVSYSFNKGALKGLTVLATAYNLNNEPLITYDNDDPRRVINYQYYGASYSLGASYKF
ncbi:catecholate siderophore receptor CirA [Lacunisphaera limnophila]|uniref:Catecholate siderophore receptor CirA n=1 Tax=Lacunisphaera limnophila TaxID=1838286 RepID=A0A1D8AT18_9BACT|nr:TonB-dependent receptor [Lacunisphaera limnophila]AOS44049.1 catecholate siderophore receptor CirA [Lacunisphaera limnophila]